MVTIECVIPQKHHRTVMGAKGVKVQGITSEFDVQIKFPDRDAQGTDDRCMVMVFKTVQTKHMSTFSKEYNSGLYAGSVQLYSGQDIAYFNRFFVVFLSSFM